MPGHESNAENISVIFRVLVQNKLETHATFSPTLVTRSNYLRVESLLMLGN